MHPRSAPASQHRIHILAVVLWAFAAVSGLSGETLTVATYNVENYGLADRMTDAGYRPDYPKPEAQKSALRRVIRDLQADVIVLQEMGPQPFLDELQRDLRAEGCEYPHVALALASDKARHVAVLSKRPLGSVKSNAELEFTYLRGKERVKRGLLEVTLATEAGELVIYGVHLKSRLTDRADDPLSTTRRSGEARCIRDAILTRFPAPARGGRYVVVGDCNDTRGSRTLENLQRRGQTEVAILLKATDSRGEAWTYAYKREESYSRFDHILVSPLLMDSVIGGRAGIADGDGVAVASDHRPLFVRLNLSGK